MAISFSFPFKKSKRKQVDPTYQMYQQDYGNSLQQNDEYYSQNQLPNYSQNQQPVTQTENQQNNFFGFVPKKDENYYKPYNFENPALLTPNELQSSQNFAGGSQPIPIPKNSQNQQSNQSNSKFTNQFSFSEQFEDKNAKSSGKMPNQNSNYAHSSNQVPISNSTYFQKPSQTNSMGRAFGQFKDNFADNFDQDFATPVNNPYNNSKVAFQTESKFNGVVNNLSTPSPRNPENQFQNQANFNGFNLDNTFKNNSGNLAQSVNNYGQNQLMLSDHTEPDDYGDYDDIEENFQKEYYNPYQKKSNRSLYIAAFTMLFVSATIFTFTFNSYQQKQNRSAVAGVLESQSTNSNSNSSKSVKKGVAVLDEEGYKKWIEEKNNNKFSATDEDLDNDGLTNGEEFLLQTNPLKDKTCNDKTDVENLVALVDPSSCKAMDLSSEENVKKFSKFINIPKVREEFLTDIQKKDATIDLGDKKKSVLSVFEIAAFTDLDKLNPENIKQTSKLNETKLTYLEMVSKIGKYIQLYRSQDPIDRNYASPVHPAVYLDTALKYDVPLKYMLAIARSESRFGTDRFDNEGNLTRPGEFKNIYSLGLDDSGNNHGFETWEKGVEAFGKWYQRFQKRGIKDCSKWRIYNPNGDYCAKIEASANEIQTFLDKK